MPAWFRYLLFAIGVLSVISTIGFFFQMSWATALWPWPETRLSYIFLASIALAIASPVLWAAIAEEYGALMGGAINLSVTNAGMAWLGISDYFANGNSGALALGLASLCLALFSLAILFVVRNIPIKDKRVSPTPVRVAFAIYIAMLVIIGVLLVFGQQVFPWHLQPQSAVAYGWIFLGAACYFAYALIRPSWHNARGQLWGFLAYDLVLIFPFLAHFANVPSQFFYSLIIYVGVLLASGVVSIYYLFISPETRGFSRGHTVATR